MSNSFNFDTKDIYCITNIINGKKYIGQSNNVKRRFNEHIKGNADTIIHNAIKKYGEENFKIETLETNITNYNEREQYWIKELNTLVPNGYNMTEGGEFCPHYTGCDTWNAHFNKEQLFQIVYKYLPDPRYKITEIARIFNVQSPYISAINSGQRYHIDSINYPIRSKDWIYKKTYDLLKSQKYTLDEINNMVYIQPQTIKMINYGSLYKQPDCDYPIIRISKKHIPHKGKLNHNELISFLCNNKEILNDIINDLQNNYDISVAKITKKYNLSRGIICGINEGKLFNNSNLVYPLRKYTGRHKLLAPEVIEEVTKSLQNGVSVRKIRKNFSICHETLLRINNGYEEYKIEGVTYPIRDLYSKKVK